MSEAARARFEAMVLNRGDNALFCVLHAPPPGTPVRGAVLHVPAFAEEMNKARRAVALAARALAQRGLVVLLLDPTGTGDSGGDFADATWQAWLEDVRFAAGWLADRSGHVPALWGLRAGCLLINELLPSIPARTLVFWAPALSGEAVLTQFLRLRAVGDLGDHERPRESVRQLIAALEAGASLEVAGYVLSPSLALPMRNVSLGGADYRDRGVAWLEVSPMTPAELSPASKARIEELRATGASVSAEAVNGLAFWMTQEIDECPTLIAATLNCSPAS
jgi:exosortase A-associated hydrolase 2